MPPSSYPDDIQPWQVCIIEGCRGPNCSDCGTVNYRWLGYLGAVASAAKRWGVSKEDAEEHINKKAVTAAHADVCCEEYWESGTCMHSVM